MLLNITLFCVEIYHNYLATQLAVYFLIQVGLDCSGTHLTKW